MNIRDSYMIKQVSVIFCSLLFLMVSGCATLQSDYEKPSVIITDFRALPSEGIAPKFQIGLHIINPNRTELALIGISYSATLEGHEILKGVSNRLPVVEAYGEADLTLVATTDLFSSIGLFADLMNEQRDTFNYLLKVKMDIGGIRQNIHVKKEGSISLVPDR
jgi:LEA14-like dessication related protein